MNGRRSATSIGTPRTRSERPAPAWTAAARTSPADRRPPPPVIATPVFRRIYAVRIVEEDGVYLLSEREPVLLEGQIFTRLAPLLDGRHTVDAINAALHGVVDPVSIQIGLS